MQTRKRIFDDAARVAGGAAGTFAGVRRELDALVRHRLDRLLESLDLVTRDEFEAVKAMAAKARAEQEALSARLKALETARKPAKRGARKTAGRKKTARKAAPRGGGGASP